MMMMSMKGLSFVFPLNVLMNVRYHHHHGVLLRFVIYSGALFPYHWILALVGDSVLHPLISVRHLILNYLLLEACGLYC